jgi:hypothetical protein
VGGVAAVVTASENNTVLARRSNEFLFSKLNLATETTGSLPASQGGVGARPRPVFSVKGIEWMANNGEASTTVDALAGSRVHYSLHHEEDLNGHTYDAISAVVTAGATTSSLALYSYNEATGQPGVLLWQSVTGTNPASHIMVFASGTWDAASSVGYKNGSNQLVLTCSMTVVKAALGSGNTTWRTLNATQTRNIGTSTDIVTGYTGWTENVVWPTFSPTASVSDLSTPNVSTVLRWIS